MVSLKTLAKFVKATGSKKRSKKLRDKSKTQSTSEGTQTSSEEDHAPDFNRLKSNSIHLTQDSHATLVKAVTTEKQRDQRQREMRFSHDVIFQVARPPSPTRVNEWNSRNAGRPSMVDVENLQSQPAQTVGFELVFEQEKVATAEPSITQMSCDLVFDPTSAVEEVSCSNLVKPPSPTEHVNGVLIMPAELNDELTEAEQACNEDEEWTEVTNGHGQPRWVEACMSLGCEGSEEIQLSDATAPPSPTAFDNHVATRVCDSHQVSETLFSPRPSLMLDIPASTENRNEMARALEFKTVISPMLPDFIEAPLESARMIYERKPDTPELSIEECTTVSINLSGATDNSTATLEIANHTVDLHIASETAATKQPLHIETSLTDHGFLQNIEDTNLKVQKNLSESNEVKHVPRNQSDTFFTHSAKPSRATQLNSTHSNQSKKQTSPSKLAERVRRSNANVRRLDKKVSQLESMIEQMVLTNTALLTGFENLREQFALEKEHLSDKTSSVVKPKVTITAPQTNQGMFGQDFQASSTLVSSYSQVPAQPRGRRLSKSSSSSRVGSPRKATASQNRAQKRKRFDTILKKKQNISKQTQIASKANQNAIHMSQQWLNSASTLLTNSL